MPGCLPLFSHLRPWRRPRSVSKSRVGIKKNGQPTANQTSTIPKEEHTSGVEQARASDNGSADGSTAMTLALLPNELQREIFIFAVDSFRNDSRRNCLRSIACLMLVAQRFYDWILPCLYNTISLKSNTTLFLKTIQSRHDSPTFFTQHVRKLCLPHYTSSSDAELILSLCNNVINLAFWIDYYSTYPGRSIVPLLSSFPLRRLDIEVRHFDSLFVDVDQPAWLHELTHLSLVYWDYDEDPDVLCFEKLPSLTHLALNVHEGQLTNVSLLKILSACKQLKVMAVYNQKGPTEESIWSVDSRVAFTTYFYDVLHEWELQANDLEGCGWERAEIQIVAGFECDIRDDGDDLDVVGLDELDGEAAAVAQGDVHAAQPASTQTNRTSYINRRGFRSLVSRSWL
ncbi:hypothetical protein CPB83DRAFT_859680 [Crepidotus variabilis]|uniref:F-box domain-containing protein n=1 Tax=Crepidotus variabilis TaxID=179855 RepID=A0A9P6EA92_9AGAR|nr:hypothetical protein CPB83DRAFT_859680 [Crepidotus variabilis]